jgi:hypothetical protein
MYFQHLNGSKNTVAARLFTNIILEKNHLACGIYFAALCNKIKTIVEVIFTYTLSVNIASQCVDFMQLLPQKINTP